jgi:hypothetical protein
LFDFGIEFALYFSETKFVIEITTFTRNISFYTADHEGFSGFFLKRESPAIRGFFLKKIEAMVRP